MYISLEFDISWVRKAHNTVARSRSPCFDFSITSSDDYNYKIPPESDNFLRFVLPPFDSHKMCYIRIKILIIGYPTSYGNYTLRFFNHLRIELFFKSSNNEKNCNFWQMTFSHFQQIFSYTSFQRFFKLNRIGKREKFCLVKSASDGLFCSR